MKRAKKQHILESHYLDFYSRAMAILGNDDDARDAVQEAVVQTLVRPWVDDPLGYCYRATVNQSLNILRRRRRLDSLDALREMTNYSEERIVSMVNESKEALQPLERLVLEFHREEGYTLAQLSAIIGVSLSTVKRLLASAEKKMKQELGQP